jgi:ATP-dependent Lhr-like helicase
MVGGFGGVYPGLKAMEEAGRLRRGYFVAGLGATQFALPGALDLLRSCRDRDSGDADDGASVVVLSATDPANPYGASIRWPASTASASVDQAGVSHAAAAGHQRAPDAGSAARGPSRTVGASVILVDGALVAYLARGDRMLLTWLPDIEPERSRLARHVARVLADGARSAAAIVTDNSAGGRGAAAGRGMLLAEIDGRPTAAHPLAPFLAEAGFVPGAMGFQMRRG